MASIARTVSVVAELKVRVNWILACAKVSKPDCYTLNDQIAAIYADSAYQRLPRWAKESVAFYAANAKNLLSKEYTILLSTGLDGRKMIGKWDDLTEAEREFIRAGNSLPSAFYWLECRETCTDEGIITKVMTPTDKVYFRSKS